MLAVIGHGRSCEGKGWGPRIDACDRVIRMWNWGCFQGPDYGTRYDYGIIEVHPQCLDEFYKHNKRKPACGYVASKLWTRRRARHSLPEGSVVVDQRVWLDGRDGREVGGIGETGKWELTRGGIAACWAITQSRPGDTVVLVGCDNLYVGETLPLEDAFAQRYIDDPAAAKFSDYVAGVTKSGNHDFLAERDLIELMGKRRRVEVYFAQDAWTGAQHIYSAAGRRPSRQTLAACGPVLCSGSMMQDSLAPLMRGLRSTIPIASA